MGGSHPNAQPIHLSRRRVLHSYPRMLMLALALVGSYSLIMLGRAEAQSSGPKPLVHMLTIKGKYDPSANPIVQIDPILVPVRVGVEQQAKILQPGTLVGAVTGPGDTGFVSIKTLDMSKANIVLVTLDISGLRGAGTFTGQADIIDHGDASDTISLTVNVIDIRAAAPLVTELTVQGTRPYPWSSLVQYGPAVILFPAAPQNPTLIQEQGLAGLVGGQGKYGKVYRSACSTPPAADVQEVCLTIQGLDAPGSFSGSINVVGDGNDKNAVKLTVNITDDIRWAILAAVIGILVGGFILWVGQSAVPMVLLIRRGRKLHKKVEDLHSGDADKMRAVCNLTVGEPVPDWHHYTLAGATQFGAFWTQLKRYATRIVWNTSNDDYKGLVKLLDDVQADIGRFCQKIGPGLRDLQTEITELLKYLDSDPLGMGADRRPPFVNTAASYFVGVPVPVGQVQTLLDRWTSMIALMHQWMDLATRIQRYDDWAAQLSQQPLANPERVRLAFAQTLINATKHELYSIGKSQDLDSFQTQPELDKVYGILAELGGKYEVWEEPKAPVVRLQMLVGPFKPDLFTNLLQNAQRSLPFQAVAPQLLVATGWGLSLMVFAFALVLALFAGLQANYLGKNFGTLTDYIGMAAYGAGAQMAVTGLVALVGQMFSE